MESIQSLINRWGSLMKVTGGTLRKEKSWWYLADYVWRHGIWTIEGTLTDLNIVDINPNGVRVTLERLRYDTASEILSIWLAPNDDRIKLIRELKSAAIDWGERVRMGNGSLKEYWTVLHANIYARLK